MARKKKNTPRGTVTHNKLRVNKEMTVNDKMVMYLNEALALENAAIPRLQSRIREASLNAAKEQLRHHLEETKEQQDRLRQLIVNLGGRPTADKARLPIPEMPRRISSLTKRLITSAEKELKSAKEDAIIENAEVVMYDTLLQLTQQMGISDAIPSLTQNLSEEREMADWLRGNMPVILTDLYPAIQAGVKDEPPEQAHTVGTAEA